MSVALEQFVKQLADSGVIAPGKLENFVPPKAQPKDAQELARQLVQSKQLTRFQAQEIYLGRAKSLILGNYTILDRIGAGGMGQVFKAEHRRMHRVVAIKMLPTSVVQTPAAIARFQREVEAAAKLIHRHIVGSFDANEANGIHFLAMEYVEGSDLSAIVKKDGPLSVEKAVDYILQAARGLEFAHGEGVVHRDIKPANLLLDKKGVVKILDMGLARIETDVDVGAQAELTGTGAILGTVDYMAPEQGLSTKHADARADIYSLGCTLYYLLIGKPAYSGESMTAKLLAHHQQPIPDMRKTNAGVPESLQSVFAKMVAKKVDDRYQAMSEVVAALEALDATGSSSHTSSNVGQTIDTNADGDALTFLKDIPIALTGGPKPTKKPSIPQAAASESNCGRKKLNVRVAAAVALGFVILAVSVMALKTRNGTPVVEANQPDGALAPKGKNATPSDSAFQKWLNDVASLPVDKQVETVAKKMQERNPGFDGYMTSMIDGGVTRLGFVADNVTDISPVRALAGLQALSCSGSGAGKGKLADLSPLQGMALSSLELSDAEVSDLSPLKGMNLTSIQIDPRKIAKGMDVIRQMKSLAIIGAGRGSDGQFSAAEFWKKYDAGEFGKAIITYKDPAFQQWANDVSKLPAEAQIEAVVKKLQQLNPGFDGKVSGPLGNGSPTIENGVVTQLHFAADNVTDLSPVRALSGLKSLGCDGMSGQMASLDDLSPLEGLKLTILGFTFTKVSDLSPLQKMPLKILSCSGARTSDLSPLKGMQLAYLDCSRTPVSDLSPLHGMPLEALLCNQTLVADLSPLRGMHLTHLISNGAVSDLSPLKGMPLVDLWCNFSGVSDLSPLNGMPLTGLHCDESKVKDLSPLKGMPLTDLGCASTRVTDLSPLKGMKLARLACEDTNVSDLSPLAGMPLTFLDCTGSNVSDFFPLKGMPLKALWCGETKVADLSPLSGAPLQQLAFNDTHVFDASPLERMSLTQLFFTPNNITKGIEILRQMKSLKTIGVAGGTNFGPDEFWKKYDDGEFLPWDHQSGFKKWMSEVASLPAEKQAAAVGKKLQEVNPGFDGIVNEIPGNGPPKIENGVVTELRFSGEKVTDISPVRALVGLKRLHFASYSNNRVLPDLSPLKGMPLTYLDCGGSNVSDLSPLKGMALTELRCIRTHVSDLSPLKGMKLQRLNCGASRVADLSPLKGLPLNFFNCGTTAVSDLSPLKGMPLAHLEIDTTPIADLSPLVGMPLVSLRCYDCQISDLSPLAGMALTEFQFTPSKITKGIDVIRRMKSLQSILIDGKNEWRTNEFWRKYDAGEFTK